MDFNGLLIKMFTFAVLLAIGNLMARKGFLSSSFSKDASKLMLNVFIVASIINSVLGDRPDISNSKMWRAMLVLTLVIIAIYIIGFATAMLFRKEENAPQTEVVLSATNSLFIGLPVVSALCGSEAVFYIGMCCVPFNIILYTYGVWRLGKGKGALNLKNMLSPTMLASLVSLVLFIVNRPLPSVFKDLIGTVSGATVPFSMILIGATMGNVNPIEIFKESRTYIISAVRLIIAPIIVFFVARILTDNVILQVCCVVLAGCPTGTIVTPLSIQYGYDGAYSSKLIAATTILSLVTLPLILYILF